MKWFILISLLSFTILFSSFFCQYEKHTALVDLNKLFESFEGRKELSARLQNLINAVEIKKDSFELRSSQLMSSNIQNEEYRIKLDNLKNEYNHFLSNADGYLNKEKDRYTNEIWIQIRQYVKDYCELNNVEVLIGLDESGTILYSSSSLDVTKDVLNFINRKYEGF